MMSEENQRKRYFWLKLQKDFFKSLRIKKLRKMAGGDTFVIIYLKMQLLSITNGGILEYTGLEQDFAEELALDLDEGVENVRLTLTFLLNTGLMETSDNINFLLPYAVENTGSETDSARRMREARNLCSDVTPQLSGETAPAHNVAQCAHNVQTMCAHIEKEKNKSKSKSKREKKLPHGPHGLVTLTPSEMQAFIVDEGEERTLAAIERLDAYMNDYGKKYQSCAAALRRWAFRAVDEDNARQAHSAKSAPAACNVKQYDFGDEEDIAALIDKI